MRSSSFLSEPTPLLRYAIAVAITLTAAVLRLTLQPVMGVAPPYITFYLAVAAAAAYGGFGAGLCATVLGGLLGMGMATWPLEKLQLATPAEQLRLLLYLASGLAISLIGEAMTRARRQLRAEAERLRQTCEELRLIRDRLLESDRSKDRFLAMLAHELRNPLMPIKHSLVLVQRSPGDPQLLQRALAVMERQADQLSRLVDDLLDITRINHDKLDLQRTRVDLRQVVARSLDDHRTLFLQAGVGLHGRRPPDPVWVCADASRMAQILGNLLHNALKFTPVGGEVRVELEAQADQAVLVVRDSGRGIAPELLGRIFEPFMQAEHKRDVPGLGLGLTLVKRLVELHGGTVRVRSAGPDQGAEFTIRLPLDHSAPVPAPTAEPGASAPPRQVLIVEDLPDSAEMLSQLLRSAGHRTEVCHTGSEGIERARATRPDVVLCDIGLPDLDGFEVARALRSDPGLADMLLVALTGYGSPEVRERARAAGFDDHLVKPVSAEELDAVLVRAIPVQPPRASAKEGGDSAVVP